MKFEVGDTVFWCPDRRYSELATGTITKISDQGLSKRYHVFWHDCHQDNNTQYTHSEMEILSKEAPIGYQDFCDKIKDRLGGT